MAHSCQNAAEIIKLLLYKAKLHSEREATHDRWGYLG